MRISETHLALTVGPEIDTHPDEVVDPRVRPLVQQQRRQRTQRVHDQPRLDAPMHDRLGKPGGARQRYVERPFPSEGEDAEDEVEGLEDGNRVDGAVEVGGEEVPEDLGPEEAFEGGGDLVYHVFVSLREFLG